MKSASLRAGYRFSKMQAVANVNTGLVEVFRSSDYCIVAAVTLVYELAVIRTHSPNRVTDEHDAAVLTHEPLPIVAEMMEHSVVRSEREGRGENRDALAANGWRWRIGHFGAAISEHADTRLHGRDL